MNVKEIMKILKAEEERVRRILKSDAGDFEELQSDWQERDSAAERNLRAVEWNQYSSLQNDLREITEARNRVEDGSYGRCEDCDNQIREKRLKVVPTARKCMSCQEASEDKSGARNVTL